MEVYLVVKEETNFFPLPWAFLKRLPGREALFIRAESSVDFMAPVKM